MYTSTNKKKKGHKKNDKTLVQVYSANENSKKHNNYNKHNAKKKIRKKKLMSYFVNTDQLIFLSN